MKFYVLTVVLTAVATLALTWVVWRIGMRYRLYPEIRERDVHTTPKPRVGGVAMFLGVLVAFALSFSVVGHLAALAPLALCTGAAYLFRDPAPPAAWNKVDTHHTVLLGALALPLTVLGVWLQYSHNLRVEDGAGPSPFK